MNATKPWLTPFALIGAMLLVALPATAQASTTADAEITIETAPAGAPRDLCTREAETATTVGSPLDDAVAASNCYSEPYCLELDGQPCPVWYEVIPCLVYPEFTCGQCDCFRGTWLCTH